MPDRDWKALCRQFQEDGVVYLERALQAHDLRLAQEAFQWTFDHPGPGAQRFYEGEPATFYQDLANPEAPAAYRRLLTRSAAADIAAGLWGTDDVWFFYEQIFVKTDGPARRTPWHQDTPYLPIQGDQLAVMWISFDAVPIQDALEFVPGSHRGTLYNGSAFSPEDDTTPIYQGDPLPRLPDIEAERDHWDIVSWAVEPGDVIVFHPGVLHGGGANREGRSRRTLSLRFFGPDASFARRPRIAQNMPEFSFARVGDVLKPGEPFRNHPSFPKLRPRAEAFQGVAAE